MNRVFIVFKDGKVYGVRSTETLAKVFIRSELATSKTLGEKAKFTYEEWGVPR